MGPLGSCLLWGLAVAQWGWFRWGKGLGVSLGWRGEGAGLHWHRAKRSIPGECRLGEVDRRYGEASASLKPAMFLIPEPLSKRAGMGGVPLPSPRLLPPAEPPSLIKCPWETK